MCPTVMFGCKVVKNTCRDISPLIGLVKNVLAHLVFVTSKSLYSWYLFLIFHHLRKAIPV